MRFNFSIVDDDGEIVVSDWTTFDLADIREFGEVETVDIHTGSALRATKRIVTKRREAAAELAAELAELEREDASQ